MSDAARFAEVYARLRQHFGYAKQWWPGTPLELAATALLVQRCDWSIAWAALGRLRGAGVLSVPALAAAEVEAVRALIRGVPFSRRKAERLVLLAKGLLGRGFTDLEPFLANPDTQSLRNDLLSFAGIGDETADCILCFAAECPQFVADEYARRILGRLGLLPEDGGPWDYRKVKAHVESHFLADLTPFSGFSFDDEVPLRVALCRDLHAQLVELGRHHCRKENPRCESRGAPGWKDYAHCDDHCPEGACTGCPLRPLCRHAAAGA